MDPQVIHPQVPNKARYRSTPRAFGAFGPQCWRAVNRRMYILREDGVSYQTTEADDGERGPCFGRSYAVTAFFAVRQGSRRPRFLPWRPLVSAEGSSSSFLCKMGDLFPILNLCGYVFRDFFRR